MDKIAKNFITEKISKIINKQNSNFQNFYNLNKDFNSFINNFHLETVMTHMKFKITPTEYSEILEELEKKYSIDNNKQLNIKYNQNLSIPNDINKSNSPVRTKKNNRKKIEGFVDTLIVAFITGSFIGIILLNLYSKIVQNI